MLNSNQMELIDIASERLPNLKRLRFEYFDNNEDYVQSESIRSRELKHLEISERDYPYRSDRMPMFFVEGDKFKVSHVRTASKLWRNFLSLLSIRKKSRIEARIL